MSDSGELDLESGFPYDTVRGLMRKGHSVRFADGLTAATRRSW